METRNNWKAWFYLAPMLILMLIFTFYPLINAFIISFYDGYLPLANGGTGSVASANLVLTNYAVIFKNQLFWQSIRNTFVLAFISVPVSIIISLFISVALKSIPKLKGLFQTIFFLPYVTNGIAIGMAFAVMFNTDYGLFNAVLNLFGMEAVDWIGSGSSWWAQMGALMIFTIWESLAFKILVFTSGLQNIDKQYYDAAKIDHASKWTIFKRITVPLLSPLILYISITSMIGALKAYNSVIGLFGEKLGGQPYSMITIVAFVYKYRSDFAFQGYYSYAAAAAIILFFITLIFSLVQTMVSKKRVHY